LIYIVEDDLNIRELESYALKNSGYEVAEFSNGADFFQECEKLAPSLVLLDIMLPGEDGLSILRRLKKDARFSDIPVIMVTAKAAEVDAVIGLDAGADDYITKPFGIMELISRVKAVLRRTDRDSQGRYECGDIVMDDMKRVVTVAGASVDLTFKEYELLKYLLMNSGIVLSRDKIMDRVWGIDYEGESRTVDMHIKALRQKLGGSGGMIKTIRSVGYKIDRGE
jgi:two-component system alkaline phosphatase synthesis response regulator PhoP